MGVIDVDAGSVGAFLTDIQIHESQIYGILSSSCRLG